MTTYGVVVLDAEHSVDTVDGAPFDPPEGLRDFYGHPDTWPGDVLFAVPKGVTAGVAASGDEVAMRTVADAVRRLDGRCDVIVGGCGFFSGAWAHLDPAPRTPTLLSGFDLLDDALRATAAPVAVLSFADGPAQRVLAGHPAADRIRVVGISPAGDWPLIGRPDWATAPAWTREGVEGGLREVLTRELTPGGLLDGVGALVVECTIVPQFRAVLREYTAVPVFDVGTVAVTLLT